MRARPGYSTAFDGSEHPIDQEELGVARMPHADRGLALAQRQLGGIVEHLQPAFGDQRLVDARPCAR